MSLIACSSPTYVTEIHRGGPEVIESVSDEWHTLCGESGVSGPFYRPEWIASYARAFSGNELVVLVARSSSGKMKAALPLSWCDSQILGVPIFQLRGCANVHSVRFDCIAVPEPEREPVLQTIWNTLKQLPGWDIVQFPYVPEGGACEELLRIAGQEGYLTGQRPAMSSPYLEVAADRAGDGISAFARKSHFRQNLRRRLRNAEARWRVELHVETTAGANALETFYELEAKGWKGEHGTAISCDQSSLRFYNSIAMAAAKWGSLKLYTLKFDGKPVAAHFGVMIDNCYYAVKVAYDEEYKQYSPGHLIVWAILRECQRTGISEFDFLGADMDWKSEWSTTGRRHSFLYLFNKTAIASLCYAAKFRLLPAVRAFTDRLSSNG